MKLKLKDFQEDYTDKLVMALRLASREATGSTQAVIFSSPTGTGKTLMATAAIERLIEGDSEYAADPDATFIWLSDQPEINEQTRRKMLETSNFGSSELIVIDASFDQEVFLPGRVYFLNTQKLGREKQLVTHSDDRTFTIWETISNTLKEKPENLFVFIDEAHRGMALNQLDRKEAASIVQKFIVGVEGELIPVPIIIGITATPDRFDKLIQGSLRVRRPVIVPPEAVRASGLLKDAIRLFYPTKEEPTDVTMLRAAARSWKEFSNHWKQYCKTQKEHDIKPIFLVQVQDGTGKKISNTDILEVIRVIDEEVGPLPTNAFTHSFQEGIDLDFEGRKVRYLPPVDINMDSNVVAVLFKTSLNTGWDCPRAEVMMSFRKAIDATLIAQLVGRMVRAPLARRISGDEFLNMVSLYLPHFDQQGLKKVVESLTSADPDVLPPIEIEVGEELMILSRRANSENAFSALSKIPSYIIPKVRKTKGVTRLMKLARLLANDDIRPDAVENAKDKLLSVLGREYERLNKTKEFTSIVESTGKVEVKSVEWQIIGNLKAGKTIVLDFAKENVDDLFDIAGRKLGEGLHKAWWKSRVYQSESARLKAKLECVAFCITSNVLVRLEQEAQRVTRKWLDQYRTGINALNEAHQQPYNEVRQLAPVPEEINLIFPANIEVRRGDNNIEKHLYVDERGLFLTNFNKWESKVLSEEVAKSVLWLRNYDRKSWSLTIPYKQGGEYKPLYPDFLVTHTKGKETVVGILDPHQIDLADAPAKAAGLAEYAARHGHLFDRIELIILEDEEIRRLNLKDEEIRGKVMGVSTNEHLRQLYESK